MRRVPTGWVAQQESGESWKIGRVVADGIYIVPGGMITYIHLAGTSDEEAGPRLEFPTNPALLRELATAFTELAEFRERGGWGSLHQ